MQNNTDAASEPLTFSNVALYVRASMFGVRRIDCARLAILTGQKYAQYSNAIRLEYLERGKRKAMATILDYDPWARVCALQDAIVPASSMVEQPGGSRSRYASSDPRYVTDLEDAFAAANTPFVWSIGAGKRAEVSA